VNDDTIGILAEVFCSIKNLHIVDKLLYSCVMLCFCWNAITHLSMSFSQGIRSVTPFYV